MKLKSSQAKETSGETDTGDKQGGCGRDQTCQGEQGPGAWFEAGVGVWQLGRRRAKPGVIHGLDDTEEGAGRTPRVHGGGSGDTEETRSDFTRDSQLKSQGWGLTNNLELSPST